MNDTNIERYARHLVLKEIGGPGQQRLLSSHVVLVGAGGLGGPAALYLAAAGVGKITLIDDDEVGLSNLQRQVQFTTEQKGQPKADAAIAGLSALNPDLELIAIKERLNKANIARHLDGADIVLDGCDNFETRFLVNAYCHRNGQPLISGAVARWTGQLGLFASGLREFAETACYQCFVPDIPPDADTCERVGIVGALTGVIGSMMALETIKWLTKASPRKAGWIQIYESLNSRSRTLTVGKDPACPVCGA